MQLWELEDHVGNYDGDCILAWREGRLNHQQGKETNGRLQHLLRNSQHHKIIRIILFL